MTPPTSPSKAHPVSVHDARRSGYHCEIRTMVPVNDSEGCTVPAGTAVVARPCSPMGISPGPQARASLDLGEPVMLARDGLVVFYGAVVTFSRDR